MGPSSRVGRFPLEFDDSRPICNDITAFATDKLFLKKSPQIGKTESRWRHNLRQDGGGIEENFKNTILTKILSILYYFQCHQGTPKYI